ncbi:MAG: hypothetical protein IT463_12615, partial [Planctomycetes bacterium]|nr:hypothetical protein [Planctomycetota bacterium]
MEWQTDLGKARTDAATGGKALLLYFAAAGDCADAKADKNVRAMADADELRKLSQEQVLFVFVPAREGDAAAEPAGPAAKPAPALIPKDRLAAEDLWASYGVPAGPYFVLTDSWGNEHSRHNWRLDAKSLGTGLSQMQKNMAKADARMQAQLDKAQGCVDRGEREAAMPHLREVFAWKLVGRPAGVAAAALFGEICVKVREEAAALKGKEDTESKERLALLRRA